MISRDKDFEENKDLINSNYSFHVLLTKEDKDFKENKVVSKIINTTRLL